ncbi:MAG: hypothetical protein KGN79_12330 [Acidobacteriota bacterium]|nr:hypothetical protein [Acidobacteriota bacterium]
MLEHIEHDRDELERAASHLKPDGRVIVLSPAHQSLYTPFDKAIGHFRRYNRASLKAATPPSLVLEKLYYLDAAGLFLSAGNRLFLRSAMPTKQQLSFWDNWVIPISRIVDPLLLHAAGKTIIGVWQLKNA